VSQSVVPVHLEEAKVPFLDLDDDAYIQDPFDYVERIRTADSLRGRVLLSSRGVEILDYTIGRDFLSDARLVPVGPERFREMGAGPLLMQYLTEGKLTALPDEKHREHRRVLVTPFSTRAVERDRAAYERIAHELVDDFIEAGECDFVSAFSHVYPIRVLCHALGIGPAGASYVERITLDIALMNAFPLAHYAARVEAALADLSAFTERLLNDRQREPTDDFITRLLGYVEEGKLTRAEIVWTMVTLLQAAHYTTRNQTTSIMRALVEAGLWEEVARDPSLVPAAVEEGLRHYPVVMAITRVAIDEVVIEGIAIPSGTVVRFNMLGAVRDGERFHDPNTFDLSREIGERIPFGFGRHRCLGQHMARADMEVATEVATQRLRDVRIARPPRMAAIGSVWGPETLELEFTPGARVY